MESDKKLRLSLENSSDKSEILDVENDLSEDIGFENAEEEENSDQMNVADSEASHELPLLTEEQSDEALIESSK